MSFYRDRSKIHGSGCFAKTMKRKGLQFDCPSYRIKVATDTAVRWEEDEWYELFTPYKFINHSKTPNAELYLTNRGWTLYILRKIEKDDEVTIDYGDGWDNS